MNILSIIIHYVNPIDRLGKKHYSIFFPLTASIALCILSELYTYNIAHDPLAVGTYIIFLNVAFIIYFSFRDGVLGGFIAAIIAILYYYYIIFSRHYTGQQLASGEETTIELGLIYFLLASVIGLLKQTIDSLIEKEANQRRRLQQILQQLPVGVVITNSKGIVEQTNKRLTDILGTKLPDHIVVGKDVVVPTKKNGKNINPAQSPLAIALRTGKTVTRQEYFLQRPDGKKIFIRTSASAIRNNGGKIIAGVSITSDITHEKELEMKKDDFVNMASHELKTPVTSMKIYIDLLLRNVKKGNDENLLKPVTRIKAQTEKLQELINDLLDVSRLQTGKLSFRKEVFQLDTLAEEIVEELKETSNKHRIIVIKKMPSVIYADKFRIYQVLTNLLTNAIKYSPEGDIEVSVTKKSGKVLVGVKDHGIGIEKNEQKKIFEKLYQVNEERQKTFPGFGMGLYISKEIIKRHKGAIWVESVKGKGSTFYFSLPIINKK